MALTARDHYNQGIADSSDALWHQVLEFEAQAGQKRTAADSKAKDSYERRVLLQDHAELRLKAQTLRDAMKRVQALKK